VHRAKAEAEPAQKKAALEHARAGLSQAFAADPLLKRRFGAAAAEADRSAGAP
jgi:hypothetical protein